MMKKASPCILENYAPLLSLSCQPDSSSWLLKEGLEALNHLGAHLPLKGVLREAWVLAAYTPGTFLYESLISCKNSTVLDSSPLAFSISLPRRPGYTGCIHCPLSHSLLSSTITSHLSSLLLPTLRLHSHLLSPLTFSLNHILTFLHFSLYIFNSLH